MKIDRQVTTRNDGFQTQQDRSDQSLAPPVTAARHAGDRDMVHLPPSDRMKEIHRAFRDAFPIQLAQIGFSRARGCSGPCNDALKRSEEHTSELQSLMRISSAVFCLKKKNTILIILFVTSVY